jgi:recombination associated protein RdgC
MGLISSTHSMSRYHIEGKFETAVMDEVRNGLIKNSIPKLENEYEEISAGWTPYESPYNPED